jgi:hypothetical protein
MATQYTDILKLALPVQGELTGTWGDTVNTELTSMIEEAIAGLAVINTWVTNSHTLTIVEGATSESRAAILRLTDTGTALTGAGTIICPNQTKVYLVENDTGQEVTVKTSAGTGITVPTGEAMLLFCDATNVDNGLTYLPYDNSVSGLTADNVKDALDELTASEGGTSQALTDHINDPTGAHAGSAVSYNNATSGLSATEVQAAIDELDAAVDTNAANIATNAANIQTNADDIATNAADIAAFQAVTVASINTTATVNRVNALTDLTKTNTADVTITLNDASFVSEDIVTLRKSLETGVLTVDTTNNQILPDGTTATSNFFPDGSAGTVELKYLGSVWTLRII